MQLHYSLWTTVLLLIPVIHFAASAAEAAEVTNGKREGQHGPPPVAIDACVSLTAGDACKFIGREDMEITGTCFAPAERELACKPANADQRKGKRNDQEER